MIVRIITAMFLFLIGISVSAQEERALKDTLRTEEIRLDSLAVLADSLQVETLLQRADSLVLKADSLNKQPDSLAVRTDSTVVIADSLALRKDSLSLGSDTLVVPVDTPKVKKVVRDNRNAKIIKAFAARMKKLNKEYFDYVRELEKPESTLHRNVKLSSNYYRLFMIPTFYISPLEQAYSFEWEPGDKMVMSSCDSLHMCRLEKTVSQPDFSDMVRTVKVDRWVNRILLNFYMEHPERVIGNELYFADVKSLDAVNNGNLTYKEEMKKYMAVENPVETANAEVNMLIMKPNFWKYSGSGKLQFTQHSVSDNWYTGGENTNALYSELNLSAKYDNKQGIEFENKLRLKLGFITAPSDTVHKYKTNSDEICFDSKLGIKAFKDLYYTISLEVKTQFFPNYRTNSDVMVSNFLSPLQLKFSIAGLDYKYSKKNKKMSVSILGSPLTYKHVYLKSNRIYNPSSFGVESGRTTANTYGSELTAKLNWKISPNITWDSKFVYFTTYEKVQASWENTFDFKLNRYWSTTLFVHPRFDDGVTLTDDNRSYFQFKEMLTFGLSYSW